LPPLKPMGQSRRGVMEVKEQMLFNQMQVLCLPYLDHPTP
jgi:hypothetical protein